MRALRPHQWVKNGLVFLPALLAHRLAAPGVLSAAVLAFVAFSLVASATYLVNDVVDRARDRRHPHKRHRPFASGALPPAAGCALAPVLAAAGGALAWWTLPAGFAGILGTYAVVGLAYSLRLKRVAALDVVVLAGLYVLRVLAGGEATGVAVSEWLLVFSLFLFLGLAVLKRYAELRLLETLPDARDNGRGYTVDDLAMLRGIGPSTGFLAVLVLALYLSSPEVQLLYGEPFRLWAVAPLLIFWTMHLWLAAHRGRLDTDPLVFTARDPTSWGVLALVALVVLLAR